MWRGMRTDGDTRGAAGERQVYAVKGPDGKEVIGQDKKVAARPTHPGIGPGCRVAVGFR
jgi:hypothetical protein